MRYGAGTAKNSDQGKHSTENSHDHRELTSNLLRNPRFTISCKYRRMHSNTDPNLRLLFPFFSPSPTFLLCTSTGSNSRATSEPTPLYPLSSRRFTPVHPIPFQEGSPSIDLFDSSPTRASILAASSMGWDDRRRRGRKELEKVRQIGGTWKHFPAERS